MKRLLIVLFTVFALIASSASAQVSLSDSPMNLDSIIAANEFGASSAYFSPLDDYIYYLKSSSEGTSVIVFDAKVSEYKTIKTFSPEADYLSISVDADGNIFLLKKDHDETAKSGIVCLKKENEEYFVLESSFTATSGEMIPVSLEFSPYSSMGAIRFWLNHHGDYISFVSPVSYFWDSLMGYDEVIYIVPGDLTARTQKLTDLFDVYGYHNEDADAFLEKIERGEYLSPVQVSLSPNGNMLLLLVPYEEERLVYVMDLYTYGLEILYLPEETNGNVSWTHEGAIVLTDENGDTMNVEWNGFSAGTWGSEGFDLDDNSGDWNNVNHDNLTDWS